MLYSVEKNIPIDKLKHNKLICYKKEGFGGKHISKWPVYVFFSLYCQNKQEDAQENFVKWYKEQLLKYSNVSKDKGGMYKGSLYKLIEKNSGSNFDNVNNKIINDVIKERVEQRFNLLKSIENEGYKKDTEMVEGYKDGEYIYLLGGHHRTASLLALGYTTFPEIKVYNHKILYKIIKFLRKIKYAFHKQRRI